MVAVLCSGQRSRLRSLGVALRPKRCCSSIHVKLQNSFASKTDSGLVAGTGFRMAEDQYPMTRACAVSTRPFTVLIHSSARVLQKELMGHLRSKRRIRRSAALSCQRPVRGQIVDAISIGKDPQKSRTAPFPVIGGDLSSAAQKKIHVCDLGGATFAFYDS